MNRGKSGNEFSGATSKFHVVEFIRQEDAEQVDNASKKEIGFGSQNVGCFAIGNAQSIFQRVNGSLDTGAAVVNQRKRRVIPGNARVEPQVFAEGHINAASVF